MLDANTNSTRQCRKLQQSDRDVMIKLQADDILLQWTLESLYEEQALEACQASILACQAEIRALQAERAAQGDAFAIAALALIAA